MRVPERFLLCLVAAVTIPMLPGCGGDPEPSAGAGKAAAQVDPGTGKQPPVGEPAGQPVAKIAKATWIVYTVPG